MRSRAVQLIRFILLLGIYIFPTVAYAQLEVGDSLKIIHLNEVEIEAPIQSISATASTYFPTIKQKNAAISGFDLLNRMAIPQLAVSWGNSVLTVANQQVQIFIDGIPATSNDMKNMKVTDVKKVEYYDYPSDPRFIGNTHVINFIMRKYEYGGYFKTTLSERLIANDGNLNLFGKLTIRQFTFNIGLGGSYLNSKHNYTDNSEIYRLIDNNGLNQSIYRTEAVRYAKKNQKIYWPTVQVVFLTDKISLNNTIGASFDNIPKDILSGKTTTYNSNIFDTSEFSNEKTFHENSLSYSGNWNYILGNGNSISFNPTYSYSYTKQTYIFNDGNREFNNYAIDKTHAYRSRLQFSHAFQNRSTINIFCQTLFYHSTTTYHGTTNMRDQLTTYRIGSGLSYGISINNCYLYSGVGLNYDRSKYKQSNVHSSQPWTDFLFQYSTNRKHRLSTEFHYMTSIPSSSYRSEAIFNSHSLFSYTGNPNLKPYKSFDYGVTYTFIPNNRFSVSVYTNGWSVRDRYAFVYIPIQTGILRTIEQPCGAFTSLISGLSGRLYLLKKRVQISGQIAIPYCYNGTPFNTEKTHVNYTLRVLSYLGAWNIGIQYVSNYGKIENVVDGIWSVRKNLYSFSIGWGNADWNISTTIANPFSWNWISSSNHTSSQYYDRKQTLYSPDNHCYIKVGISYIVGFGKKIKISDDVSRQNGAGSAILE